jgi:hypothetical protein
MKCSDYQKLRNALSDLEFFGVLFGDELKLYQRRLEDLWHETHQGERPVTRGGGASAEFREPKELAKTIQNGQGSEESSKSPELVDTRRSDERRSGTNKARFSQIFERITGKRLR